MEVELPEGQRWPWAAPRVPLPGPWPPLQSHSATHFCAATWCVWILVLHGPVQTHRSSAFFFHYSSWKAAKGSGSCMPLSLLVLPLAGWSNCLSDGQRAFCFPQTRFWDACWPSVLLCRREWGGSRGAFSLPSTSFQHSRWDFVLQRSNLRSCFPSGNGG